MPPLGPMRNKLNSGADRHTIRLFHNFPPAMSHGYLSCTISNEAKRPRPADETGQSDNAIGRSRAPEFIHWSTSGETDLIHRLWEATLVKDDAWTPGLMPGTDYSTDINLVRRVLRSPEACIVHCRALIVGGELYPVVQNSASVNTTNTVSTILQSPAVQMVATSVDAQIQELTHLLLAWMPFELWCVRGWKTRRVTVLHRRHFVRTVLCMCKHSTLPNHLWNSCPSWLDLDKAEGVAICTCHLLCIGCFFYQPVLIFTKNRCRAQNNGMLNGWIQYLNCRP